MNEIIDFAVWYSGMDKPKVQAAYRRYLKEVKGTEPANPGTLEHAKGLAREKLPEANSKASPRYLVPIAKPVEVNLKDSPMFPHRNDSGCWYFSFQLRYAEHIGVYYWELLRSE